MANGLQLNRSTPVVGLGTQEYTVTADGMYTLSFKSFIPYLAAGSPAVTTVPTAEIVNITAAADTGGNKNDTYWTFNSAGDQFGFYVWYNINAAGTDPAVAGRTGIEVAGATSATAATLATATIAAINASSASAYTTASAGASEHLILTHKQLGDVTAAANGAGGDSYGASFSITTTGQYGVPAGSGLVVELMLEDTVLASYGNPSSTQPIMGGSVVIDADEGDVISIVFSSLSPADQAKNVVKSIVNLFEGIGA